MSVLGNLLYDTPPRTTTVEQRTPQGIQAETDRVALEGGLQDQYGRASADPYYGMPGPIDQKFQTNQIVADAFNRAAGRGHTGMDVVGSVVAPAVTNYYDQLAGQRSSSLANLRGSLVNVANASYTPNALMGIPAKDAVLTSLVNSYVGGKGGGAGGIGGMGGASGGGASGGMSAAALGGV